MTDTERRWTRGLVEVRDGQSASIGGYAAKFNKMSQDLGGFVERIDPAFFNKSAGDGFPNVLARYNHDDNMLLGTTAAGTLRLSIDGTGLDYTADLPACRADVLELIGRGDVRQSSFAFRVFGDDWGMTDQGFPMRTLLSGALVDVAPVNSPAYLDTSTSLRSLAARLDADPAEVEAAAHAGELRKFFEPPAPTVVDLGAPNDPTPADTEERTAEDTEETTDTSGQSDTHPLLSVRLRHAALMGKRRTPLEQGATHSATTSTTSDTE